MKPLSKLREAYKDWCRKFNKVEETEWFLSQYRNLKSGSTIEPPWHQFVDAPPEWGGWRQGKGDYWKHNIWLPYWNSLTYQEREEYIKYWQVPEEWRDYIESIMNIKEANEQIELTD